jgi:rhodanese-related sulfurtransferase
MNLQISPAELAEKLRSEKPPHLLDVREQEENAFVALPNSTLIPLGELASRIDEIENWRDKEIVVYCHHGIRSLNAIAQLRHLGFTKLQNLAGGIDRWTTDVDPKLPRY